MQQYPNFEKIMKLRKAWIRIKRNNTQIYQKKKVFKNHKYSKLQFSLFFSEKCPDIPKDL